MADFDTHTKEAHGSSRRLTQFGIAAMLWIAGTSLGYVVTDTEFNTESLKLIFIPPMVYPAGVMLYSLWHLVMKGPAHERWRSEYYKDSNGH